MQQTLRLYAENGRVVCMDLVDSIAMCEGTCRTPREYALRTSYGIACRLKDCSKQGLSLDQVLRLMSLEYLEFDFVAYTGKLTYVQQIVLGLPTSGS